MIMKIIEVSDSVDADLFAIPADYTVMEMQQGEQTNNRKRYDKGGNICDDAPALLCGVVNGDRTICAAQIIGRCDWGQPRGAVMPGNLH